MSRMFWTLFSVAALALSACAPLVTQSPSGKLSPVNAHAIDGNDRVLMKGADVVTYFTKNAYTQGNPAIKSSYENVTSSFQYLLASAVFFGASSMNASREPLPPKM